MPGGEGLGRVAAGADRADGHAGAERLRHGAGIGLHTVILMREELAGAAGADLDLVEHEEDALLVAQVAQALQELLRGGTHAALALDGLGQDGADVFVHDVLDGLEVVELGIAEAGGQGLEVAVDGILTGGGAGGEGAAVEGVLHRDDDEALGMAVILGVLAGELDLAFVGLGAGVGKEDLIKAAVLDDELRGLDGGLIVEVVGAVEDGLRTLLQALDDGGMAVAETVDGDAADEIEVLVAVLVEDVDALAALHGDGHTDMVAVEILVTVFDDFRIGLELFDHGRVLLLKFYVFFTT